MSLLPYYGGLHHWYDGFDRDFDRAFSRYGVEPYWRDADHSLLHVGNDVRELVNDEDKFAVSLDVSQFRPEELKVHVEGHQLTVEGQQEHHGRHGRSMRSFMRSWKLPDEVDVEHVRSTISNSGHLSVEAPKVGAPPLMSHRNIPIEAPHK